MKNITGGEKLCEFSGSCASGWTQLDNWSSTVGDSCSSNSQCDGISSCVTGQHAFANIETESCSYRVNLYITDCTYYGETTGGCSASVLTRGCY